MSEHPAPDMFDRRRRAARRQARRGDNFFGTLIAEQIAERLGDVTRPFHRAVVLGGTAPAIDAALAARGTAVTYFPGDEDRLDVEPGSIDLIIWPGGLDRVNDVPGALLRCRFALRPDGLLIGAFAGDGSLPQLRAALRAVQAAGGPAVARLHPQIEVRAVGDLLQRCGLALPVVDVEALTLAYRSIDDLVRDLRGAGMTNLLAGPLIAWRRADWVAARTAYAAAAVDGRTQETLRIIHFSGWAPDPSQPQPARRGSATASLAAALQPRDDPAAPGN